MANKNKNIKSIRKLLSAKTSLNDRSEYLNLKCRDVYNMAKKTKYDKHKKMYIKRARQIEQLADNALENAFVLDGLIDSIMSLSIMVSTDVQKILSGLCTAAIDDAMDKAATAIDSAREISDTIAQPIDDAYISDSELNEFIDEGFGDKECTEIKNSIYQSDFPKIPTENYHTKDDRVGMSDDRSGALVAFTNGSNLKTVC